MLRRIADFLRSMPEEVWFFLRIAAYAVFIGTVYWFLTYEDAGTMLLLGFGIAAGFGTIVFGLGVRSRRRREEAASGSEAAVADGDASATGSSKDDRSLEPDGPFGDERGRIPGASVAPIIVGFGAALTALGLVFGPGLILAGVVIGFAGAVDWGRSASAEYRAIEAESRPTGAGDAGGRGSVEAPGGSRAQRGETPASTS